MFALNMSEYATFDHFARELMFFDSNFNIHITEIYSNEPVSLMQDASFLKGHFADGHHEEFWHIFDKTEYQDLQTEEQFFRYAIPRCLNLIDKERYFYSLMLIAGFLHEFLYFLKETRVCDRFHFTAYTCLLAIFKRAFEDSFEVHGGFKGLKKYMKEIFKYCEDKLIIDNLNQGNRHLREKVVKLIEKCDDFPDDSFHLNDYELSLIRDDDIKNIIELLDSGVPCEDPLNLKWPPSKEEMQEVLERQKIRMSNWKPPSISKYVLDSCDSESNSDVSDTWSDVNDRERSDLENYIFEIINDARERYGHEIFHEKMKLRKCPCCGIKCYQFSRNLYFKQGSALTLRVPKWKSRLQKFISYVRFRISGCFNFNIVYKRK